jgi:hypothetical protein
MRLPGTWRVARAGCTDRRRWLYDPCSLASARKAHPGYPEHAVRRKVEEARRWRDATELERIEARILEAQTAMGYIGMGLRAGGAVEGARAQVERLAAHISELQAERNRLTSVTPADG